MANFVFYKIHTNKKKRKLKIKKEKKRTENPDDRRNFEFIAT